MVSIARPTALADEIDKSYFGRVMRLNRWESEKEATTSLSNYFGVGHLPRSEMSALELLSIVADIPLESFALKHSTIPYRRSITSSMPDLPHGSTKRRSLLCNWGMTRVQPASYFCMECAAEDLIDHGTSYWRRSQQIPGRYWCNHHGVPLYCSKQQSAFLTAPLNVRTTSEAVPCEFAKQWSSNQHVNRFLSIADGLGSRASPLEVRTVSKVLKPRAVSMGVKCGSALVSGRKLLSDLIAESFPLKWLEHIVPSFPTKQQGEIFHRLDGVLHMSNASSSSWVYILAASVLFESAEEALQVLCSTTTIQSLPRQKRQNYRHLDKMALLDAYIECQGHHSLVANRMSLPHHIIKAKLMEAGLPNLALAQHAYKKPRASADAYYLHDMDFDGSAKAGGLTTNEMAKLLASSNPNFKVVLKAMNQPKKPRRCSFMGEPLPTLL